MGISPDIRIYVSYLYYLNCKHIYGIQDIRRNVLVNRSDGLQGSVCELSFVIGWDYLLCLFMPKHVRRMDPCGDQEFELHNHMSGRAVSRHSARST